MELSAAAKSRLIALAQDTLKAAFSEDFEGPLHRFSQTLTRCEPVLVENHPCFVTLMSRGDRLRGCMGCLTTYQSLYKNVYHFTRHAAFEDPRFEPVQKTEVSALGIKIAVLGPLTPLPSPDSVVIGTHGLYVRYAERHGVLLAEVATQHRWNVEEFRKQTCEKAGLDPEKSAQYEWSYFEEIHFS